MSRREFVFEAGSEDPATGHLAHLVREFEGRRHAPRTEESTYLDTFDWRVHRAGGWLRHDAEARELHWSRNGRGAVTVPVEVPPAEAADLPAGPLRAELGPILEPRRLLSVVETQRRTQVVDILDVERKTIARVHWVEHRVREPESHEWLAVRPRLELETLRGYEEEAQRVEGFLRKELGLVEGSNGVLDDLLAAVGRVAGRDPSTIDLHLDGDAPAVDALKTVFRSLLDVIVANQDGLQAEVDTEFLHDFRVAIRRTRSVLVQVKRVLPPAVREHYLREFRWLGGETGAARDLDVMLLLLEGAAPKLAPEDRGALEPVLELLRARRSAEQERIVAVLTGQRYRDLVRNWRELLDDRTPPRPEQPDAQQPIRRVASKRIRRRHRKVLKLGAAITAETPVERLHELRIECKKLRYLLEVFRSAYDPSIEGATKELKRLQTVLGDLNDARVQAQMFHELAQRLGERVDSVLVLGRMIAHCEERQTEERQRFAGRFERFARPADRALFDGLFSGGGA